MTLSPGEFNLLAFLLFRTRQQISHDDLNKFAETFRRCAGTKGYLERADFAKMVSSKNVSAKLHYLKRFLILVFLSTLQKLFIDRAFAIFDRQKNGRIVVDEYIETLAQLAGKNADTAVEFLFRIYDINGDGSLHMGELKEVLKASIADSGMTFDEQVNKSIIHRLSHLHISQDFSTY